MQTLDRPSRNGVPDDLNSKLPLTIQMQNIKAVLFDLFDTLLLIGEEHTCYFESLAKLHSTLLKNGFTFSYADFEVAYLKVVEQINAETSASLKEPHFNEYVLRTLSELGFAASKKDTAIDEAVQEFCQEFNRHIGVDSQAIEVIKCLQTKYKIGLISNLIFSESAGGLLKTYQMKNLFDFIVVSGDVNLRKPHPRLFNIALNRLGVKASEAVFVGDTLETDIKGAINVGMIPVHIKRRKIQSFEVADMEKYLTINKLEELLLLMDFNENTINSNRSFETICV